jgi:hypothetical protein
MALANERIGAMSNLHSEQYNDAQQKQEVWENTATNLRKERTELLERIGNRENQQRADFRADIRGAETIPDFARSSPRWMVKRTLSRIAYPRGLGARFAPSLAGTAS